MVEKQALEESLQALSSGSPPHTPRTLSETNQSFDPSCTESDHASNGEGEVSDGGRETPKTGFDGDRETPKAGGGEGHESEDSDTSAVRLLHSSERKEIRQSPEDRIATLKQSLKTLTLEKCRVDAALTADKNKLLVSSHFEAEFTVYVVYIVRWNTDIVSLRTVVKNLKLRCSILG